jgi:hypothetical protein
VIATDGDEKSVALSQFNFEQNISNRDATSTKNTFHAMKLFWFFLLLLLLLFLFF